MISNADLSEERNEYNAVLSAFYEPRFTGVAGDVAFYVAQAQAAGSPALELGCTATSTRRAVSRRRADVDSTAGLTQAAPENLSTNT
jgi:hypothetical protein